VPGADYAVTLFDDYGITRGRFARFPGGWGFIDHQTSKRELERIEKVGFGPWSKEGPAGTHKPPEHTRRTPDGRTLIEFPGFKAYLDEVAPILDAVAELGETRITLGALKRAVGITRR